MQKQQQQQPPPQPPQQQSKPTSVTARKPRRRLHPQSAAAPAAASLPMMWVPLPRRRRRRRLLLQLQLLTIWLAVILAGATTVHCTVTPSTQAATSPSSSSSSVPLAWDVHLSVASSMDEKKSQPQPNANATTTADKASTLPASSSAVIRRRKRYLDFLPLTRVFFRVNVKDNLLKGVNFWSQAYGYRANYVIENQRRTKRSDVHDTLAELISYHGFDGRACVLKSMCEASKALTPGTGIVFKLFKMIFSPHAYDVADVGARVVVAGLSESLSSVSSGASSAANTSTHRLPQGDETLYPYLKSDDCDELDRHCPLSLMSVSPYTDE